ncbi:MAG: hypothetical protein JWN70_4906 [Planctomycetaceae bacterium]|nr:hypothetical protein [Planctomycetaceae bacterium]
MTELSVTDRIWGNDCEYKFELSGASRHSVRLAFSHFRLDRRGSQISRLIGHFFSVEFRCGKLLHGVAV